MLTFPYNQHLLMLILQACQRRIVCSCVFFFSWGSLEISFSVLSVRQVRRSPKVDHHQQTIKTRVVSRCLIAQDPPIRKIIVDHVNSISFIFPFSNWRSQIQIYRGWSALCAQCRWYLLWAIQLDNKGNWVKAQTTNLSQCRHKLCAESLKKMSTYILSTPILISLYTFP